jgi:hypothetical protein
MRKGPAKAGPFLFCVLHHAIGENQLIRPSPRFGALGARKNIVDP